MFVFVAASCLLLLPPVGAFAGSSVACPTRPHSRNGCGVPFLTAIAAVVNDHERQADANSDDGLGLLRGVDPTVDDFYADKIDMSKEGLAWLDQPGLMWEAAKRDAAEKGIPVEEYIENVEANIETFADSGIIYDRKELLMNLNKAFATKKSFTLLLGGKNVGKSAVLTSLSKAANQRSELLVLYIDARLSPGRLDVGLANGVAQIAAEKLLRKPKTIRWVSVLKAAIRLGRDAAIKSVESSFLKNTGKNIDMREILEIIGNSILESDSGDRADACETLLDKFINIAEDLNKYPVLVIDEANAVLGIETNGTSSSLTNNFLTNIVSYTKQQGKMNVILASSEHAYPYRLEREGLNLLNLRKIIFAGEIPPKEMWKLLVSATYEEGGNRNKTIIGMGPHLAELCLSAYGGHFWTILCAIQELSLRQDKAKASFVIPDLYPKISKCLETTPASRPLLEAMAQYGFATFDQPANSVAELISKENVGGVVTANAACIGLSETKWIGATSQVALIPSSQCVRLRIAQVLLMHQAVSEGG